MDENNALIVALLIDRQREIEQLRQELSRLRQQLSAEAEKL